MLMRYRDFVRLQVQMESADFTVLQQQNVVGLVGDLISPYRTFLCLKGRGKQKHCSGKKSASFHR
jgi:hypothetical protein